MESDCRGRAQPRVDPRPLPSLCHSVCSVFHLPPRRKYVHPEHHGRPRKQRRGVVSPLEAGLADPRPVTDYTVVVSTVGATPA
jgi:hypothetical protein